MESLYDVKVEGIGKVKGGIYKNINLEGISNILDNVEANDIHAEGTLKVNGSISCENISCEGMGKFKGNVEVRNHISFEGIMQVLGNIQAKTILVEGVMNSNGLINADAVSMEISRSCNLNEIGGSSIKISSNSFHKRFWINRKVKISCKIIEGDNIYLDNVNCDVVRGKNITIGKGCNIANIECSGNLDINKESKVINIVRV
ncbi:MAG: polymer-forming cytoskeletal protein [Clostridium sp.]|nr:polymer-forming cytoskeletal protein [Clostridium sp.]